jgi:lysophospholipase L1-like esterase
LAISIGYTSLVAKAFAGELDVCHSEGNASDSAHVLANLPDYLEAAGETALVVLNCGLHDIKTPFGSDQRQVPLADYRKNLTEIVSRLVYQRRKMIWATSTPVIHERHHATKGFDRYEQDARAYNAAAAEIVAAAEVPVIDLYAVVVSAGVETCLGLDGVHMTEAGNAALAEAVVAAVRAQLGNAS